MSLCRHGVYLRQRCGVCDGTVVLLLSGGLDSTTLLYRLRADGWHRIVPLVLRYGQRHVRETDAALAVAPDAKVLEIPGVQTVKPPIPDAPYDEATMQAVVYPNRNMLFLAYAAGVAVDRKADAVAYAAHGGDHAIYPDCRPGFVEAMRRAIDLGNWNAPALIAPFLDWTKAAIVSEGARLGVPFGLTWSCYRGGTVHCGTCGTCRERREAFQLANVPDPTAYA